MDRASDLIAKIIDPGAFHKHPLVDMTARRESALRRAWKILAASELVDGDLYCKALDKYDELTNKHIALQLEFENFQRDVAADYANKAEECEALKNALLGRIEKVAELQDKIERQENTIADLAETIKDLEVRVEQTWGVDEAK